MNALTQAQLTYLVWLFARECDAEVGILLAFDHPTNEKDMTDE